MLGKAAALTFLHARNFDDGRSEAKSEGRSYSTYPPSIQSELFYTDSEKFWAQSHRVPGALPRFPPSPEALVPVCMRSRVRVGDPAVVT